MHFEIPWNMEPKVEVGRLTVAGRLSAIAAKEQHSIQMPEFVGV
jgi:hypothetical protein